MGEELFDVCDGEDRAIGQAPRSQVHARGLLHRAVHVFVFNRCGELLVQMRSAAKDEYPCCYTSSASGHVAAGESYDECAPRELAEELGIEAPLVRLAKFPAGPGTANEHSVLYRATTDAVPRPDPGEIDRVAFRTLDDIAAEIAEHPERFSPPFRTLFAWYRANCA